MTRSEVSDIGILDAKVRSLPALSEPATAALLGKVRVNGRGPALDELVEHQLAGIIELAEARRGKGVEVSDLTQEGTIAGVVAVLEYAAQGGAAAGLDRFVGRLVASHMDDTIELAAIERAERRGVRPRHGDLRGSRGPDPPRARPGARPSSSSPRSSAGPRSACRSSARCLTRRGPATTARSSNTSTTSTRSRRHLARVPQTLAAYAFRSHSTTRSSTSSGVCRTILTLT